MVLCVIVIGLILFIPWVFIGIWHYTEKQRWKKMVKTVFPLKSTITFTINGKDYEYDTNDDFVIFFKKHLTNH